ncbi:MAG: hypothetical protein HQM08_05790 [Candidatus Riflebacteria bacterium]|nr:hypothetical protein [Candidatus Riflebacteria bacterium]
MISFAGIIRRDGNHIPESWVSSIVEHSRNCSHRIFNDLSAVFVEFNDKLPESSVNELVKNSEEILLIDAQVDNPEEFKNVIGLCDHPDSKLADASLVELIYKQCGEEFVKKLYGNFALAFWNSGRQRLFLACDFLGSKPIFYHVSQSVFVFATELKLIFSLPFVPTTLNEIKIAKYLCNDGSGAAGTTFYEAIRTLPGGHTLILQGEHLKQSPYWTAELQRTPLLNSDEGYASTLRELITKAVTCQLRGGKTIAVHLSGGLDSSSIACIAARQLKKEGRRLIALCSVLPKKYSGPESDERKFIEAVLAQEENIDVFWLEHPTEKDPFESLTRWFQCLGQPAYSNVTHIEGILGKAGMELGLDIALSGFGGDFFPSSPGHNAIFDILISGKCRLALSELKTNCRKQGVSWKKLLKAEILAPVFYWFRNKCWHTKKEINCLNPDLRSRIFKQQGATLQSSFNQLSNFSPHELMRFILEPGHLEQCISSITQVFAKEFSQELKFPLLDIRVIEFMLGTPVEQLRKGGWPRSIMRRAMKGILPEIIRLRQDKGGAFDPAITSRFVASRTSLINWAEESKDRSCWKYVDRQRFLESLSAVERAPRSKWGKDFFLNVLPGGIIAHFIDWHEQSFKQRLS